MKKNSNVNLQSEDKTISRKEAINKIGTYGKYAALTALGTYIMLSPKKAQAVSPLVETGGGF